jgi:hypothetical protein
VHFCRRVLLALVLSGTTGFGTIACHSADSVVTPNKSSPIPAVETIGPDAPMTAVAGGAVVSTSPGSPAACGVLANAAVLRTIASTFGQFTAERAGNITSPGPATAQLRAGAAQLRALAAHIDLADIPVRLRAVADAMDVLTTAGIQDKGAIAPLSDALARLGEAVQEQCHFAIG